MKLCLFVFSFAQIFAGSFTDWWEEYKISHPVPHELVVMEDYYVRSALPQFVSLLWESLNKNNIDQIVSQGYINFKQTVACNYFTFITPIDSQYSFNLVGYGLPVPKEEIEKKHELLSLDDSIRYNTVTAKYLQYLIEKGEDRYLEILEEPPIGNPPCIVYKGKRVSQDILNSLMEYIPIRKQIGENFSSVLEVGAGSGRTAYCLMKCRPGIKYYIVDIPPALYLSQTYLSEVFPEKKVFKFRPIANFEEMKEELFSSDLIFLTPDQMHLLPSHSIDLFLAIDCLHEMKPEVIQFYIDEAQRLALYFYNKNWKYTVVDENYVYYWYSYPIPTTWVELFNESCFIPSAFFHSMYKIE